MDKTQEEIATCPVVNGVRKGGVVWPAGRKHLLSVLKHHITHHQTLLTTSVWSMVLKLHTTPPRLLVMFLPTNTHGVAAQDPPYPRTPTCLTNPLMDQIARTVLCTPPRTLPMADPPHQPSIQRIPGWIMRCLKAYTTRTASSLQRLLQHRKCPWARVFSHTIHRMCRRVMRNLPRPTLREDMAQ